MDLPFCEVATGASPAHRPAGDYHDRSPLTGKPFDVQRRCAARYLLFLTWWVTQRQTPSQTLHIIHGTWGALVITWRVARHGVQDMDKVLNFGELGQLAVRTGGNLSKADYTMVCEAAGEHEFTQLAQFTSNACSRAVHSRAVPCTPAVGCEPPCNQSPLACWMHVSLWECLLWEHFLTFHSTSANLPTRPALMPSCSHALRL